MSNSPVNNLDPSSLTTQIAGAATQNPPAARSFLSKLGQGLHDAAPQLEEVGARLAQAGGNPGPMQALQSHRQQLLQQQQINQQGQLQQSQEETQGLQRQLLSKQIENVRTPEQQSQANLDYQTKLEQSKLQNSMPKDIVGALPTGGMGHFNQSVGPNGQLITRPTVITANPDIAPGQSANHELPSGAQGPMPPQQPSNGMVPPAGGQQQLMAMPKVQGGGTVVPDPNSPTGYSKEFTDMFGNPVGRVSGALPPYAQQPTSTTNTQTQMGPNGVNQVNTTTSLKRPVFNGGSAAPSAGGGGAAAPSPQQPRGGGGVSPSNMNYKIGGPEAKQIMDQDVALNQTMQLANNIRNSKALFASMIDAGKIQLAADPSKGLIANVASRGLTPQEAKLAGDFESLAEHINTLRGPLGGTGFRGPEAWAALQAQRGSLMQNPVQLDRVLGNTTQILQGLLNNHRKLLTPPGKGGGAAAPAAPASGGGFQPF